MWPQEGLHVKCKYILEFVLKNSSQKPQCYICNATMQASQDIVDSKL